LRGADGEPGAENLLAHAVKEVTSNDAGAASMRLRTTELLFVEALRRYTLSLPENEKGWLAGLRDPVVGEALQLLHDQPGYPWTVDKLASRVAVSRSLLATRFKQLLDEPPMRYLSHWRLLLATRQLHDNRHSIATIAECVGYNSSEAFQRAFKKLYGEAPGAWRKRLQD
jgi:AraC-like DNA-binding protein